MNPLAASLLPVAYVLTAFGVIQAITLSQRHVADGQGALRWVGVAALGSGLAFAALMLLGQSGGWGLRLATVISFAVLLSTMVLLAAYAPARRFGPMSSALMITFGTLVLKSSFLWAG